MKIGLFGGSFNPIHNGHIHLAKTINSVVGLDKLIFIPSKISPHKSNEEYVSNEHRFNMCKLAIEDIQNFEVSDFELTRDGISYTIYTVRYFKEKYPNDELFLLIGSDMLLTFDQWREYQEIMSKVTLAVISREDGDYNSLLKKAENLSRYGKILIPDITPIEVSSTEIRKNIRFNQDYSCNLDEKVVQYIKSNNLYQ